MWLYYVFWRLFLCNFIYLLFLGMPPLQNAKSLFVYLRHKMVFSIKLIFRKKIIVHKAHFAVFSTSKLFLNKLAAKFTNNIHGVPKKQFSQFYRQKNLHCQCQNNLYHFGGPLNFFPLENLLNSKLGQFNYSFNFKNIFTD